MSRKILFLVFTDEVCKQNHAFWYAKDLKEKGHQVKMVIEGPAIKCLNRLDSEENFSKLFKEVKDLGIIDGLCKTASGGCSTGQAKRDVKSIAKDQGLVFLDDLHGHAGITSYIDNDYQIITF